MLPYPRPAFQEIGAEAKIGQFGASRVLDSRRFLLSRRAVLTLVAVVLAQWLFGRRRAHGGEEARRRGKWIQVILSQQRLNAWENGRLVRSVAISSGKAGTPTPRGSFRITRKYLRLRMRGPDYDLPNVPYVMFFRRGGYAIHGAYWHNNFGTPMSHGCINMPVREAGWLYRWAPVGTPVVVQ
ncbi:MAG: L,D-transpeptidase [Anaerolineae bacterium]|nr:L,D-transpeptidase [Thermoflexales bacterium]MDW8394845.1 L,D-transpeptidase [Anaerolineae bacterium]